MTGLHPALILIAAAPLAAGLPGPWRKAVLLGAPVLAVASVTALEPGTAWRLGFLGYELLPLQVDALSRVFALIFALTAFLGNLYALHVRRGGEHAAAMLYAGAALGVVYAGDWLTLFVFWELLAASSVFLIWYRSTPGALASGLRYLVIHFIGGSLLLAGVILLAGGGDVRVASLTGTTGPVFWLILIGVAVNAAIPPLHAWLTDSYPEATLTGSVFLSAFTTKVAVYVLLRVFPGTGLLVWLGVAMALYGVVYAVLENDIRRLLSYHIVSQVGFMVAGAGIGTELALNGSTAHAFCHILYKALLFMAAGTVIHATGRHKLTDLGGLARAMPAALVLYLIGALSISGAPLFNGFVSKSIVVSASSKAGLPAAELLLIMASIGTFLSVNLKLPYFAFFGEARGLDPARAPVNKYLAMGGAALLCVAIGLFPGLLYAWLPFAMNFEPYTVEHVLQVVQLMLATGLVFALVLPKLGGQPTITLDVDWLYRRPLAILLGRLVESLRRLELGAEAGAGKALRAALPYFRNPFLAPTRLTRVTLGPPRGAGASAAFDEERGGGDPAGEGAVPAYDENRYRLRAGLSILFILAFLALAAALALGLLRW